MAWPYVSDLVSDLLDPPNTSKPSHHGVPGVMRITLHWVKRKVSEAHFMPNPQLGRSVLRLDSKIRTYG